MRALIFCIDVLPFEGRIQTSGGSLRSKQFVDRFEAAGFEVVKAVPSQSLLARTQRHLFAGSDFIFFDVGTQAEVIAEARPDVVVWGWPLIAQVPIKPSASTISIVDLNGFQDIESAVASGADQRTVLGELLRRARQADIVVFGSAEQRAYWEGLYRLEYPGEPTLAGFTLPYWDPHLPARPYADETLDFFYVGSFLPWLSPFAALFALADELRLTRSRLRVFASTQPVRNDSTVRTDLSRLASHPNVVLERPQSAETLYREIGFRGVGFDLLPETFERRFAYPIRTISYLTHGIPLLFNDYSCLSDELVRSGAGWTSPPDEGSLRARLRTILGETHQQRAMRSLAAARLAERLFAAREGWSSLFDQLATATPPARRHAPSVTQRRRPNVLVVSDDKENILNLRCVAPLESLMKRDAIGGYAVVGKDGLRRSTLGRSRDPEIHSVIVQRVPQVPSVTILELTKGRYTYDIDDNLLVAPHYRPSFPPDFAWKVRTLLSNASAVTLTNGFLARSLACASGLDVAGKARVLPNPLLRRPHAIEDRAVRRVIFASSDQLPLIDSAEAVFSAVGAFCRRRELEFCYVGSYPDHAMLRDHLRGVETRAFEQKPYYEYLDMLEGLDALAIVPLETRGDAGTVEFVKSKSDIKAVEYLGLGCSAVFSDAAPYRYSDLPLTHLVPNDADCWTAALEAGLGDARSTRASVATAVADARWIGGPVTNLWLDVLLQNVLTTPLQLQHVVDAIASDLAKLRFAAWPSASFDALHYVEANPDIRVAVEAGELDDLYEHYLRFGRWEGRTASPFDTGRSLLSHIEESKAAAIGVDSELGRTDQRIRDLKQQLGVS